MDTAGVCVLDASSSKKYIIMGKQRDLSIRHVHVRIALRWSGYSIGRKHGCVCSMQQNTRCTVSWRSSCANGSCWQNWGHGQVSRAQRGVKSLT